MSLAHQLIRNVLTSWLGYGLRIVIGFVFVPYITACLGSDRYGIWVIAFQVIGYFTLFDLGLERAVVKFVAQNAARKDLAGLKRVLSTAASVYLILGGCALVACWLFGLLVFDIFKAPLAVLQEGRGAFYLLSILLACRLWLMPWISTIIGLQRSDIINALDIGEEILRVALMVTVLLLGGSLTWLAAAVLGAGLLRMIGAAVWLRVYHPEICVRRAAVESTTRAELFRYAGTSLAINIAWIVVFGTDMALLGLLASSAAAGLFAPAANIMLYLRNAVNAAGTPLAPAVTSLDSRNLSGPVQDAYIRGIKYVSFGASVLAIGVIFFSSSFVKLWLTPEFESTAQIMVMLAFGAAFFLPQIIGNAVLFGLEKHRYLLVALGCEATIKLVLSFLLIGPYGAIGMAAATAIAQIASCLTIYPYMMSLALSIPVSKLLLTQMRFGILAATVSIPATLGMLYLLPPDNWALFFLDIMVVAAVPAGIGFRFVLERSDRERILDVLTHRRRKPNL